MIKLLNTIVVLNSMNNLTTNIKDSDLTLNEQKKDILSAINTHSTNENVNINIKDIFELTKHDYKYLNNNTIEFNYDIFIKSNSNNFLSKKYRVIEVIGEFDITLSTKNIKELNYKVSYVPGHFNLNCSSQGSLIGKDDNAVLYLIGEEMNDFMGSSNPLKFLHTSNVFDKNVSLTNDDWTNILDEIYYSDDYSPISTKHAGIIIIKNGNLEYTNARKGHITDLLVSNNSHLLASYIYTDAMNNLNYYINKNILTKLNDLYISYINKEDYGLNNWNVNKINDAFTNSKYKYESNFSNEIMNLFEKNYNTVLSLLKIKNNNGFLITFDKNDNFINVISKT